MHANQCCALYSKGGSRVNMHKKTTKDQMMPARRERGGGGWGRGAGQGLSQLLYLEAELVLSP